MNDETSREKPVNQKVKSNKIQVSGSGTLTSLPGSCFNRLSPELQKKILSLEQVVHLPDWPDKTRGIPNCYLRSALFGLVRRGKRKAVEGQLVTALKTIDIRYTGWELDQGDFDVLAQTFHLHAHHNENVSEKYIRFHIKSFLRAIGRQPGKSSRIWLKNSFRRLSATTLEINIESGQNLMDEKNTYAGSLVDEFVYNSEAQTYFLKLNPKLAVLFDAGWTQLQWQQRLQLKSDLAKWLYGFYASHRNPYPMKVKTLKQLCGSESKRLTDYRRNLRLAMAELVEIQAIYSWQIDEADKLHVQRFSPRQFS